MNEDQRPSDEQLDMREPAGHDEDNGETVRQALVGSAYTRGDIT